jgi:hypothetical protein
MSACTVLVAAPEAEVPEFGHQTVPVAPVETPKVEEPEVEVLPMEIPKVEEPQVDVPHVDTLGVGEPTVEEPVVVPDAWNMTEGELDVVQRVVMAEAGGESYEGQMAVVQCIRETAEATGMTPYEVVTQAGQYTSPSSTVTDSVAGAVQAVLYGGESVVDEPIRYFYAPGVMYSEWHETALEFVCEIGGHRFFKNR